MGAKSLTVLMLAASIAAIPVSSGSPATAAPQGPWATPAVNVSTLGDSVGTPKVGVADDGTTTVVWVADRDVGSVIQASTRPPGGTFSAPTDISPAGQLSIDPALAVAPDGTTSVTWIKEGGLDDVVQLVTRPPGGSFGAADDLSEDGSRIDEETNSLGVSGTGEFTAAWVRYDPVAELFRAQVSTSPPGGVYEDPDYVSGTTGTNVLFLNLAVARNGSTSLAWHEHRDLPGSGQDVYATTRPPGGSFGAITNLTTDLPDTPSTDVDLAAAADGTAVVAWHQGALDPVVRAAIQGAGSAAWPTSGVDLSGADPADLSVAAGGQGALAAVWTSNDGSGDRIVRTAIKASGAGSFAAAVDTSPAGVDVIDPRVAVSPDGTTTVFWRINGHNELKAATRPPGGAFGAPVDISGEFSTTAPQIAIDPNGVVTAVWTASTGSGPVIQAISTGAATTPPDPGSPALRITSVKPGTPKVKRGKTVKVKVSAANRGTAPAPNAKLCLSVSKKVKKQVQPKGKTCRSLGQLADGASKSQTFKLKAKGKAKTGKSHKVVFKLSAPGTKPAKRSVKVKVK